MHLMIPFASSLDPHFEGALRELELPGLSRLLGLLTPAGEVGDADETTPIPPHERFLARARGVTDGSPPTAAWRLRAAGQDPGQAAWALLTPAHFAVGTEGVTAMGPATLDLTDDESRAFLDALAAALFPAAEGWRTAWLSSGEWAVAHDELDGLEAASVDRVLNRGVETWYPRARRLRTLLNEVQMLLHEHPLNQAREERRLRPLNAVWISGCGRDRGDAPPTGLVVDDRLRAPMLTGDLYAWSEAWKALDAGPIAQAANAARGGTPVSLTLSGERQARTWTRRPAGAWQRLKERFAPVGASVATALEAL
ncbi:hypothetical protein [Mitsuaria sp. GD03876]|uniref:hypothetical protein n=1 Tax=Mitsuaria sp. GD03876 TaxID=2975399 RepID=UPI0024495189|nr:hypothetical protein [Mitsuaria sp. GD03876]MDH0865290.1 hypothetical protein [Mitsuaria sp. GD03876]